MTHNISFYSGNRPQKLSKKLGTMMPCMTHVFSFLYGISPIKWPYSSTKTPCHFIGRLAIKWCVNLVACGQNYVGRHIDRGLPVLTFDFIGVRWYEPDFIADQALQLLRSWFLILYEESCGQESWDFILLWQMLEVSCMQNMLVFWFYTPGLPARCFQWSKRCFQQIREGFIIFNQN